MLGRLVRGQTGFLTVPKWNSRIEMEREFWFGFPAGSSDLSPFGSHGGSCTRGPTLDVA